MTHSNRILSNLFIGALLVTSTSACRIVGICADQKGSCEDHNAKKDALTPNSTGVAGDCTGSAVKGKWTHQLPSKIETISFYGNCHFSSTECEMTGSFTKNADLKGPFELTIQHSTLKVATPAVLGCLVQGTYECTYDIVSGKTSMAPLTCLLKGAPDGQNPVLNASYNSAGPTVP